LAFLIDFLRNQGFPLLEIYVDEKKFEKNEVDDNIQIVDFLASEIAAYRLDCCTNPRNRFIVILNKLITCLDLNLECHSAVEILIAANQKLKEMLANNPDIYRGPLLREALSNVQMAKLEEINANFKREYQRRRETLLKRFDQTCKSFVNNLNTKHTIWREIQSQRSPLSPFVCFSVFEAIAATDEIVISLQMKTCAPQKKSTTSNASIKSFVEPTVAPYRKSKGGKFKFQHERKELEKKKSELKKGGN